MMLRSASPYTRAAPRMSSRLSPDCVSSSSQDVASHTARYASMPVVCRSMNSWSSALGSVADCSSTALAMPRTRAMSPPMRGWRFSVLVGVGRKVAMSLKSCGMMARVAAASTSGLTCTTWAPRWHASVRAVSIRGALEAAFTRQSNPPFSWFIFRIARGPSTGRTPSRAMNRVTLFAAPQPAAGWW